MSDGVRDVLDGRKEGFEIKYECQAPVRPHSFLGWVTSFETEGRRRAVVTYEEITERKRDEQSLRLYADRLEQLRAIDQAILESCSPEKIAQIAVVLLARLVPCDHGGVALVYPDTLESTIAAENSPPDGAGPASPLEELSTATQELLRLGQRYLIVELAGVTPTSPGLERLG